MTEQNWQKQLRLEAIKSYIRAELSSISIKVVQSFIKDESMDFSEFDITANNIMEKVEEWENLKRM